MFSPGQARDAAGAGGEPGRPDRPAAGTADGGARRPEPGGAAGGRPPAGWRRRSFRPDRGGGQPGVPGAAGAWPRPPGLDLGRAGGRHLTAAGTAGETGALRRETAPVWEMVEAIIRGGAVYAPSFYGLLMIAGLIGAVGILTNSQILIVGAMVVGPEYNAIIAVALGFSTRDRPLVRDGLLALLGGFLAAIAITLLFGLAVKASGDTPAQFLQGVRPVSDLINTPNMFSVIVAIL